MNVQRQIEASFAGGVGSHQEIVVVVVIYDDIDEHVLFLFSFLDVFGVGSAEHVLLMQILEPWFHVGLQCLYFLFGERVAVIDFHGVFLWLVRDPVYLSCLIRREWVLGFGGRVLLESSIGAEGGKEGRLGYIVGRFSVGFSVFVDGISSYKEFNVLKFGAE